MTRAFVAGALVAIATTMALGANGPRPTWVNGPPAQSRPFGALPDGTPVDVYTLASANPIIIEAMVLNGGSLLSPTKLQKARK